MGEDKDNNNHHKELKDEELKIEDKNYHKLTKNELGLKLKEKEELIKKMEEKLKEAEELARKKDSLAQDYLEHLKRLQADFENYKKREEKKKKEFLEFANEGLLSNLLGVVDNLERALQATEGESNIEAIREGINHILREFHSVLSKEGVKPIEAKGHKFDPYQHEAVMTVETEDYPAETVVEELRKGYYFKSKVLRPAMVKVAVPLSQESKKEEKEKPEKEENKQQ